MIFCWFFKHTSDENIKKIHHINVERTMHEKKLMRLYLLLGEVDLIEHVQSLNKYVEVNFHRFVTQSYIS